MKSYRRKRGARRRRFLVLPLVLCVLALLLTGSFIQFGPRSDAIREDALLLVNRVSRLPESYVPSDLRTVNVTFAENALPERRQLRDGAATALEKLFAGAAEDGIRLVAVSGYRSYGTQRTIYNNRVKDRGQEYADQYVAQPGASEHQAGLAMDLTSGSKNLTEAFAETEAYRWLTQNAYRYGFIIRYPKGGEAETGYEFEPWHVRYVGSEAEAIWQSGLTLERYLQEKHPDLSFAGTGAKAYPYTVAK